MTQNGNEQNEELRVEVDEETPAPAPEPKPAPQPVKAAEGADDDDLSQYGEKVQKRIGKLIYEKNQERRQREEALQLQEEAVRYAELVARENAELKRKLGEGQTSALAETKARLEAELVSAKVAFKQAYEAGDSEAVAEAQIKIAELTSRKSQLDATAAQHADRVAEKPAAIPAPTPARTQPLRPQVDERALRWAAENPWFGRDYAMTGYAAGFAEDLVASGVDPRSEAYYTAVDEELRRRFPEKFGIPGRDVVVSQPRTTGNVVAPTSRDVKAPRTVRLSPSAVALARRLGLTPEQYAAQVLKEQQDG
jgi:hypothetical protein